MLEMELIICTPGFSVQTPKWYEHWQYRDLTAPGQRAALPTPGPEAWHQGSDTRYSDGAKKLPSVVIGPLRKRNSSASPNGSSRHVKEPLLTSTVMHVGSHTHSYWEEAAAAWLLVVWHEGRGMEKRSIGTKSRPQEPDKAAKLCHIPRSPGSADPGQPTWQRPRLGSQQVPLPSTLFPILPTWGASGGLFDLSTPVPLSVNQGRQDLPQRTVENCPTSENSCHGSSIQCMTDSQPALKKGPPALPLACFRGYLCLHSVFLGFTFLISFHTGSQHPPLSFRHCDSIIRVIAIWGGWIDWQYRLQSLPTSVSFTWNHSLKAGRQTCLDDWVWDCGCWTLKRGVRFPYKCTVTEF